LPVNPNTSSAKIGVTPRKMAGSADYAEGIAEFQKKRKPVFTGK
jgi:hypothetical protein